MMSENDQESGMMPAQWVEEKLSSDDRANGPGGVSRASTLRYAASLEDYASYPHSPLEMKVDWPAFYEWVMGDR